MSENIYELDSLESQSYCQACDGELKTGARFCSRCGQPTTEAMNGATNNKLFEATTRRLAIHGIKMSAESTPSRRTQPLKPLRPKRRGYRLLTVSLAANCVLVMAFTLAVSRVGFPSLEHGSLIAESTVAEDKEIFLDSSFEPAIEDTENAGESGVAGSCAMTPVFEIMRPSREAQTSSIRVGKSVAAVKKFVTLKSARARVESSELPPPSAPPSGFIAHKAAQRDAQNEARTFKMLSKFNNQEFRDVIAFTREVSQLLPAALQTERGKAGVKAQKENERVNFKVMQEQRKRSERRAVSTRGAEFVTVSCVDVPNAAPNVAPEVPIIAPTFVINAETYEGLGF